ncbi:MAG: hypothetical protein RR537_07930 [Longicatena sp.]
MNKKIKIWKKALITTLIIYFGISSLCNTSFVKAVETNPAQVERPANNPWKEQTTPRNREKLVSVVNSDFNIHKDFARGAWWASSEYSDENRKNKTFGWKTRPINKNIVATDSEKYRIELQKPNPTDSSLHTFALSNYEGKSDSNSGVYAELNAALEGTLYQEIETNPGETLYYSFYHSVRKSQPISFKSDETNVFSETGTEIPDSSVAINKMNFLLSGKTEKDQFLDTGLPDMEHFSKFDVNGREVARPCWTIVNGSKDSVAKDAEWAQKGINYGWQSFLFFNEKTQQNEKRYGYLYDMWDTAHNIGVSYYKTPAKNKDGTPWNPTTKDEPVFGTNTQDTQEQLNAIKKASYTANDAFESGKYKANVIGYWDTGKDENGYRNGWKRFLGKYVVPTGYNMVGTADTVAPQTLTEYAYESTTSTGSKSEGNYLDGVTFKSSSDIGVEKKLNDKSQALLPGSNMEVELDITNYGAMDATAITIKDQLAPFTDYLDYLGDIKVFNKTTNTEVTPTSATYDTAKGTLSVTLDKIRGFQTRIENGEAVSIGDTIAITFNTKVKTIINGTSSVSTAGKYIKNQAEVTYSDYDKLTNAPIFEKNKVAVSPVVKAFIIDVFLDKTAKEVTGSKPQYIEKDAERNPLQFFEINLNVKGNIGLFTNNIHLDQPADWQTWNTSKNPATPTMQISQDITKEDGSAVDKAKIIGGDVLKMNITLNNNGTAASGVNIHELLSPYYEYIDIVMDSFKVDLNTVVGTVTTDATTKKTTLDVPVGDIAGGGSKTITWSFKIRNTGKTTANSANGVNIDHKAQVTYNTDQMNCSDVISLTIAAVKLKVIGDIVDVLPAEFELTQESKDAINTSSGKLTYIVENGITTITKKDVGIDLTNKEDNLTFSVKHKSYNYGTKFTNNVGTFSFYVDEQDPKIKSIANFPMPSVALNPKTTDDSFTTNVKTNQTFDIKTNDNYTKGNKYIEDGWSVNEGSVVLCDSNGKPKDYSIATTSDKFVASLATDGNLNFSTQEEGTYLLYYTVAYTATKGTETKELKSRVTTVVVTTTNASTKPQLILNKIINGNDGKSESRFVFKINQTKDSTGTDVKAGTLSSEIILSSMAGKMSQSFNLPEGTYTIKEISTMNYTLDGMAGTSVRGTSNVGTYNTSTKTYEVKLINGDITQVDVTNTKSASEGLSGSVDNNLTTANP